MSPSPPSTRLLVRARDGNAMLPRITAALGPFDVDRFEYVVATPELAEVVIGVRGGSWQVERVAAKVGRIIGVHSVVVDGVPGGA